MSTKVITIVGSNGAGKTTVARGVMSYLESTFKKKHKLENGVLINVYADLIVIGSYDKPTGGADTVSKPGLVWDAVVECAQHSNVLYEGCIVSNVWEPSLLLRERLKEIDSRLIYVGLSTDLEQCVGNVNSRRAVAGKEPIDKIDNIETNYKKSLSVLRKAHADGSEPYWVNSDEAIKAILGELGYGAVA